MLRLDHYGLMHVGGTGLGAGRRRSGTSVRFSRRHLGALLPGAAVVIANFLLNAGLVLDGWNPDLVRLADLRGEVGIGVVGA